MHLAIKLPQRWVLPVAIILFLTLLLLIEYAPFSYTKGIIPYPLDDAYIHMGIAKNLAFHGVWGISRFEFVSASSSILYPLILAAFYFIAGAHLVIPLLINILAAIGLLILTQKWLARQGLSSWQQLLILLLVILCTPLPLIVGIGMEHTLQILFSTWFIFSFSDWLADPGNPKAKTSTLPRQILALGMLTTAIRYEGMFLIFIACLILLKRRQIENTLQLGLVSMLPVIIFGIMSYYKGNYFFPNSLLLKSSSIPLNFHSILHFITKDLVDKLFYGYTSDSQIIFERLLVIMPMTYLLFSALIKDQPAYKYILYFLIAAPFLHMAFANTNWFYRYECYLLYPSIIMTGTVLCKCGKYIFSSRPVAFRLVLIFFMLLLFTPFVKRSKDALSDFNNACQNIYDQNYNLGVFLHKYYDKTTIAINDLGCPSYFVSGRIVDLWGLGNIEVARSKRNNYYVTPFLDSLVKKNRARVAIVFDRLYGADLLNKWSKIASWHIDNVLVAGDADLSFYAVDTILQNGLRSNLQAYERMLPKGVKVIYH